MKELVVISGKGGTGKTSIVASLAVLAGKVVLADCDVDAADLHLIFEPEIEQRNKFSGGKRARIISEKCTSGGKCMDVCRFDAIAFNGPGNQLFTRTYQVDPIACEGCGVCYVVCPEKAIDFSEAINGEWFISHTRTGSMVHAKLGVAEENSGKLVSLVRSAAKKIAEDQNIELVLIDGSPGIGCPVIASITGAAHVLIVSEPTMSGVHDLKRIVQLARHFDCQISVCVNKWDINEEITGSIKRYCNEHQLMWAGSIGYDQQMTKAQIQKKAIVECGESAIADDIRHVWKKLNKIMGAGNE